ncbi:MAG: hypothetical protein EOO32_02290 [Comamonadaceae bacterium]|nr:MAG: hypothetical protein EOO32_02290 [Comamonadaceae bacterium]
MLTRRGPCAQGGFVMIIALVVLSILTLVAVGLIRTVSTSSIIAGNLAFEQAATSSADQAIEAAVTWIENNAGQASSATAATCSTSIGTTVLACNQAERGYAATRSDPTASQNWAGFWDQFVAAGYTAVTLGADNATNTAAYIIQRMCAATGDASTANGCSASPASLDTSGSRKAGATAAGTSAQVYYRITVRVSGPRNTLSFTQVMVAL